MSDFAIDRTDTLPASVGRAAFFAIYYLEFVILKLSREET